jgi:hypothetical protein
LTQHPARWKGGGRVYDKAKWKQTLHYPSHGKEEKKEERGESRNQNHVVDSSSIILRLF